MEVRVSENGPQHKTRRFFKKPSAPMVVAMIAMVLALTGSAGAGVTNLITGKDVKDKSLTGADIKDKSLTGKDVKKRSLTGKQVATGSLTGTQVADGSLGEADLGTGVRTKLNRPVVPGPKGDTGATGAQGNPGANG